MYNLICFDGFPFDTIVGKRNIAKIASQMIRQSFIATKIYGCSAASDTERYRSDYSRKKRQ